MFSQAITADVALLLMAHTHVHGSLTTVSFVSFYSSYHFAQNVCVFVSVFHLNLNLNSVVFDEEKQSWMDLLSAESFFFM